MSADESRSSSSKKRTMMSTMTLKDVFDQVATLIQETPVTPDLNTATTDQKLRLYGLYKRIMTIADAGQHGVNDSSQEEQPPSVFRVQAYAKYQAYKACMDLTTDQAMYEYVSLAAMQPNWLGEKCRVLLDTYKNKINTHHNHQQPLLIDEAAAAASNNNDDDETLVEEDPSSKKSFPQSSFSSSSSSKTAAAPHEPLLARTYSSLVAAAKWLSSATSTTKLIPRGQLDITFGDLFRTTLETCTMSPSTRSYRRMEEQIVLHCQTQLLAASATEAAATSSGRGTTNGVAVGGGGGAIAPTIAPHTAAAVPTTSSTAGLCEVVVGFAVRSLLDLYLTAQNHPPLSEIIVTPPINVPGMFHVLQHHGITIVPVDFCCGTTASGGSGGGDGAAETAAAIRVDVAAVERAITDRTVAILVVHPFGMKSMTDMTPLRNLLSAHNNSARKRKNKIRLLEDAAECYTPEGNLPGTVSPHADVSFVSFGLIKTCTALGGGLAIVRGDDPAELARAMNQVQWGGLYTAQSRCGHLFRIAKAFLLKLASVPYIYGCIALVCTKVLGLDFDALVTRAIRGFSTSYSSNHYPRDRIRQIRQRPTPALLALMYRRLTTSSLMSLARSRVAQGHRLTRLLKLAAPDSVSHLDAERSTFWLYPIVVANNNKRDPGAAIRDKLRTLGIDSTRGLSQLQCVCGSSTCCPRAHALMEQILYLPSTGLSDKVMQQIVDVVRQDGEQKADEKLPAGCGRRARTKAKFEQLRYAYMRTLAVAFLVLWCLSCLSFRSVITLVQMAVVTFTCACLCMWSVALALRWCIADYYLETSNCFARFNGLLSERLEAIANNSSISVNEEFPIASSMPALQIPSHCLPQDDISRRVMLTGATGFIGSMVLRDLLLHRKALGFRQIILLCRPKRGSSGVQRIEKLLQTPEFDFLSREVKDATAVIKVLEGDVTKPNAGLSAVDLAWLLQEGAVSHIFHCAASVSFTQSLEDAARTNIFPALHLQKLASSLKGSTPVKFVHVSTAFVHGNHLGSVASPLSENLFQLGDYDPGRLYSSMLGTQFYASKAMVDLGFHNTYTFSKCICEHLLSRCKGGGVETIIVRPTIVGPAIENPYEGWAGAKPSTLVAAACLYLAYQWNLWSFGDQSVPCIPVDVASRFILSKAFGKRSTEASTSCSNSGDEASTSDGGFEKVSASSAVSSEESSYACDSFSSNELRGFQVFNVAWDSASPSSASFTWLQYAVAVTQVGSVLGFFGRPTALAGLLVTARILPKLSLTMHQFERLHSVLVQTPFRLVQKCYALFGVDASWMGKFGSFLDLPLLFYPFMNDAFHFQSELVAPHAIDGSRYLFSCTVAATAFVMKTRVRSSSSEREELATISSSSESLRFLTVGGSCHRSSMSDIWWACSQPRGGFFLRFGGWILVKLFRATCSQITVDVTSFSALASAIHSEDRGARIVLAPTHRSFFDFLAIGIVIFSVPELQLDPPLIIAADDFETLPLIGFLSKQMNAFFVHRGRKTEDPRLKDGVNAAPCVEAFIEGSRSRDRRFLEPKTGFLRCLLQQGGTSLVVPITVNYERIAEQSSFAKEVATGGRSKMSVSGLMEWLLRVWKGEIRLGRIHIAACEPIRVMSSIKNPREPIDLAKEVQLKQQTQLYVSSYHLDAIARLLNVDSASVQEGLVQLGCKMWPSTAPSQQLVDSPDDRTELVCVLMQAAPFLARAITNERPRWARWLHHVVIGEATGASESSAVVGSHQINKLSESLVRLIDEADACSEKAIKILNEHGRHSPKASHILQVALDINSCCVPPLLLRASISLRVVHDEEEVDQSRDDSIDDFDLPTAATEIVASRQKLLTSEESLGFWGFGDSSFVARVDSRRGAPYVTMQGSRYTLCHRRVTNLLPFIESETQVKVNLFSETLVGKRVTKVPDCALSPGDIELLQFQIGDVSLSVEERVRHGTGHCQEDIFLVRSGRPPRVPDAVVWPAGEIQVHRLVELATAKSWCLIPFGGGTSVSQSIRCPPLQVEPRPILSVDLRRLNRVLWVEEENGLARIEAGILGRDLVKELSSRGYTMGHEPDSIEFSSLGGWIATKASGMKRSRYGNIEDIVKNVTVCSAGGVVQHGSPDGPAWGRESTGLSLKDLVFGSEGCLGIITSAVIRIWPIPAVQDYDGILFPDFDAGLSFVRDVARLEEEGGTRIPASVRLLDNEHFRLGQALVPARESTLRFCFKSLTELALHMTAPGLYDWKQVVCATITYEGDRETVRAQKQAVSRLCAPHGGVRLGSQAGKAGYDLTFMIAYLRDFALTYHFLGESFETFAPWSKVRTMIPATKDRIRQEHAARCLPGRPFVGCRITQLYHEGVCLYFYLCIHFENDTEDQSAACTTTAKNPSQVFAELERAARQTILEHGGSLSHHHGIGKVRSSFLSEIDSPALLTNLQALKRALDPHNIFGARNGAFAFDVTTPGTSTTVTATTVEYAAEHSTIDRKEEGQE